ncbi:hypothetical protein TD95_004576 [Thielaviopsis punctulata]|uniref:DH domain-containing protein n=1 Tax=Thielaviopsis punctulata TaxID=72032 RepID=A0A0F4Z899_9PEZI|nr:hypothetical protein TD95_004576 [Thielaviopsis punctulata]
MDLDKNKHCKIHCTHGYFDRSNNAKTRANATRKSSSLRFATMEPSTPNASTDKVNEPTTPKNTSKNTSATSKSASKPTKHTTTTHGSGVRGRSSVRRVDTLPPSLLTDFFLGRPSQARRAAERARRESMDAIKAELRQEMRAEAVRKVQPPGGVRDRVKAWQKNNAAAMATGDPQATPSEPGDVAFASEAESVTEEDRLRIKFQQQKKRSTTPKAKRVSVVPDLNEGSRSMPAKINQPPKKRVVSDDHWMKTKIKKKPSNRRKSPNTAAQVPKGFLQRSANPPASSKVREWVKAVETPVFSPTHRPQSPNSRMHRPRQTKSLSNIEYKEAQSEGASEYTDVTDDDDDDDDDYSEDSQDDSPGSQVSENDSQYDDSQFDSKHDSRKHSETDSRGRSDTGVRSAPAEQSFSPLYDDPSIHVKPLRMSKIKTPAPSCMSMPEDDGIRVQGSDLHDDGIRVTPSVPYDDGIRVTASEPDNDGIRTTPSEPLNDEIRVEAFNLNDDGIRVTAYHVDNDGIRVTPSEEPKDGGIKATPTVPFDDGIRIRGSDLGDDGIRVRSVPDDNDGIRVSAIDDENDGIRISPLQAAESALSSALNSAIGGSKTHTSKAQRKSSSNMQQASVADTYEKSFTSNIQEASFHSNMHEPSFASSRRPSKTRKTVPNKAKASGSHSKPHSRSYGKTGAANLSRHTSSKSRSKGSHRRTKSLGPPATRSVRTCSFSMGSSFTNDITEDAIDDAPVDEAGENDLPMGAEAHNMQRRREETKPSKRTSSFRHMPQVLKKVMNEGKKILHEVQEAPRAPQGNPPARIENWLNATVEPTVDCNDSNSPIKKTIEKEWAQESQNRRTAELGGDAAKIENKDKGKSPERKPGVKEERKPELREERKPEFREERKSEVKAKIQEVKNDGDKTPKRYSGEREREKEKERRASPPPSPQSTSKASKARSSSSSHSSHTQTDKTPAPKVKKTTSTSSLQRKGASRSNTVSSRASTKRPFKEALRDAFRGESVGHNLPPAAYQSHEERAYEIEIDLDGHYMDDDWDRSHRRYASGSEISYGTSLTFDAGFSDNGIPDSDLAPAPLRRRAPPTQGHVLSAVIPEDQTLEAADDMTELSSSNRSQTNVTQPTSVGTENYKSSDRAGGLYRQASYVSGGTDSISRNPSFAAGNEAINRNPSFVAGRGETINRSPSFVAGRETLERRASRMSRNQSQSLHRSSSRYSRNSDHHSLKRRLTKHSDLVSVLSMPDDNARPSSRVSSLSRSSRRSGSRSSRRQKRMSGLGHGSIAGLLRDFAAEEEIYQRELKALVDGVVPVLLKEVLNEDSINQALFDSPTARDESFSKSVVNMGVALEKLRNAHKKAPLTDIYQLFAWLERVQPVYDAYLDAWRLGFHDLVVNLAPLIDTLDDNDSLLDAMPRNDEGDLVDADGERVDVAHFLKRPLQRIKRFIKFLKGVTKVLPSATTSALLESFDQLHLKARRRYNEEIARITDKEAVDTDTSQCLNLQTMDPMVDVQIDRTRQVNAKDIFSLTLWHSNGQRLECQVELVYRDKPKSSGDPGDLLIRKTDGRQTTLLFQPVTMDFVSGRRDGPGIIIMIRGLISRPLPGQGDEWSELLHLGTDDELQIQDWLAVFSPSPTPDPRRNRTSAGPSTMVAPMLSTILEGGSTVSEVVAPNKSIVVKVKSRRGRSPEAGGDGRSRTASASPSAPEAQGSEATERGRERDHSPASDHTVTNEPSEDKPPAPPVHRTLSKAAPPPVFIPDCLRPGFNRRTSSPLKHEYLPSEVSSEHSAVAANEASQVYSDPDDDEEHSGSQSGSFTGSESESDSELSDDEIDSIDMPETELGISIRDEERQREFRAATASVMTYDSLTPSKSASQVCGRDEEDSEEGSDSDSDEDLKGPRFLAKVSQWSDKKATWKDVKTDNCWVVILPGSLEVHPVGTKNLKKAEPLVALDLTPAIMLRQSTFIDLEVRAATLSYGSVFARAGANFRFRCQTTNDCYEMYTAVHSARLKNERYNKMEADARVKAFGTNAAAQAAAGNESSSQQKTGGKTGWFGRRNSYRAAARAPANSTSQDGFSNAPSSNASAASSFLRRLTGGNLSFNLAKSTLNRQASGRSVSRNVSGSGAGAGAGTGSLYSANSSRGGTGLRAPSMSMASQGVSEFGAGLNTDAIKIRLHLLVTQTRWEDWGNCMLRISRPPPGQHMDLRKNHGLEKRVTVSTIPKKGSGEPPAVMIDAVLGSGCFSAMGNRGVVCGIWEEVKDEQGVRGRVPQNGNAGGNITKWCFQCKNGVEAQWVLRNLHQEVELF